MTTDRITRLVNKNLRIAGWLASPAAWKGVYSGPKVLINSVPKCGTNLLQEIVQTLPGMRGTFKRTVYGPVTDASIRFVSRVKKGSCSTSHLYHNDELQSAIDTHDITALHMVRDFRDAIFSHIEFIEKLGPNHRHANLFDNVSTLDEKIDICLFGVPGIMTGWVSTLEGFEGWRESGALIVKYEDLLTCDNSSDKSHSEISRIASHLGISNFDKDKIVAKSNNSRGLTFNQPGIQKWRKTLTASQLDKINTTLGKHLDCYGYVV